MKEKRKRWAALLMSAIMVMSTLLGGTAMGSVDNQTATPSDAQKPGNAIAIIVAGADNMLAAMRTAGDEDYAKIKDLTLHIINPEIKTATVDEMSSSAIRIFVFGDIVQCTNTLYVMKQLTAQMQGVDAELYYLDTQDRSADQILMFKDQLSDGIPYYLCQDRDHEYGAKSWDLLRDRGLTSYTRPLVFIVGREQETIYLSDYPYVGNYVAYVEELKQLIQIAYPEEVPALTPYTEMVYMYPDTRRQYPILHREEYVYSSSDPEVVHMEGNEIVANRPGTARLTVTQGDESVDVIACVLAMKEDYRTEWEVLKLVNAVRLYNGLLLVSTSDSFQKAADIRACEISMLYEHIRPDGGDISSVIDELKIESSVYSGENIATGQRTPMEVMESWMNSKGHRENILSGQHTHVGIGYHNSGRQASWVQYFGKCEGIYKNIALVTKGNTPAEIIEGGSLNDLDYELSLFCSTCGETRVPVIDEMCDFDPYQTGEQEVTVNYDFYGEDFFGTWKDTFPIVVNEKKSIQNLIVTPEEISLLRGKSKKLAVDISPTDAYDPSVTWHSTNPEIASVDEEGNVTGLAKGTAEIYCVAKDTGKVESNRCKVTVTIPVEMIFIGQQKRFMKPGEEQVIQITVSPTDADNKSVAWHSTDPEVVSVDDQGIITAIAPGVADIYCSALDGSEVTSDRCVVVVNNDGGDQPQKKLVEKITVTPETLTMKAGTKASVTWAVYPEDAENKAVEWYGTNDFVLTVDNNGVVTANLPGIAWVYCYAADEGKVASNWCKVTVTDIEDPTEKLVEKITVAPETLSMKTGTTEPLNWSIVPEDADNKNVIWSSTDEKVAQVNSAGKVTALAAGTAEIYCVAEDQGKVSSNHCQVTVEEQLEEQPDKKLVQSISLSPSSITLSRGSKEKLSISVVPEDAENKSVAWHSTNERVASVDADGTVTAKTTGTAEIYCTAQDGSQVESNRCKVKVVSGNSGSGGGSSGGSGGSGGGGSSGGSASSGGSSSGGGSRSGSTASPGGNSLPSYVVRGSWAQAEDGSWGFTDSQGKRYVNMWAAVENPYANLAVGQQAFDWFRFDENGKMVVGWYLDPADGRWYYLNSNSDGTLGKMMTGWVLIDGYHYYFNPNSDGFKGRMYANETTPDGYQVDASGKWIN